MSISLVEKNGVMSSDSRLLDSLLKITKLILIFTNFCLSTLIITTSTIAEIKIQLQFEFFNTINKRNKQNQIYFSS